MNASSIPRYRESSSAVHSWPEAAAAANAFAQPSRVSAVSYTHLDVYKRQETSFETYLRGELKTYSERTLMLYLDFLHGLQERGENLTYRIMTSTVQAYGYASLKDAEEKLSGK